MRTLLCLLALCLAVAACGTPDSPDGPPQDQAASVPQASPEARDIESEPDADSAAAAGDVEPGGGNPLVDLLEQDIPYGEGPNGNLVGFLAVPADAAEPLPGIIVLHEWWGLTEPIREISRRLAREGYVVLAADLYDGRTADSVPDAQALLRELVADPDTVRANIRQAYEYLELYALAPRIGSIGWDLGGRWALQLALMMPDELDAAVTFYGGVVTDEAEISTLNMPLLGLFGEQDAAIPVHEVQEFRGTLARLEKPAEIRIYSGVGHGFFFPGSPNYSPVAADDAWLRSVHLLASGLKN